MSLNSEHHLKKKRKKKLFQGQGDGLASKTLLLCKPDHMYLIQVYVKSQMWWQALTGAHGSTSLEYTSERQPLLQNKVKEEATPLNFVFWSPHAHTAHMWKTVCVLLCTQKIISLSLKKFKSPKDRPCFLQISKSFALGYIWNASALFPSEASPLVKCESHPERF